VTIQEVGGGIGGWHGRSILRLAFDIARHRWDNPSVLYLYVFGAIVGGVLLGASVVSGHGHDAGGGHDGGDGQGHDGDQNHHGGSSAATLLLSLRLWTYLLAFGGATGLVLRLALGTAEPLTAILAGIVGASAGGVAQIVTKRMTGQIGGTIRTDQLVGRTGRLLLPVGKTSSGTVRLVVANQAVDLIATTQDDTDLAARDEVLVVEVKDGMAVVTKSPLNEKER
jgi:membrane protein implicated in regulation of membrane protease activity